MVSITTGTLTTTLLGIGLTNDFYTRVVIFISIHILLAPLATIHLRKVNSQRLYGIYLIAIMLVYFGVHHEDRQSFQIVFPDGSVDLKFIIWLLLEITLISLGIYFSIKGGRFLPLKSNKVVLISLLLLFIYLVTEAPVHQAHTKFGHGHGHSLWERGHLH